MARPVKDALAQFGPVRVTARTDGRYRVLWTEAGRQVERSRPTLDDACALAEAEAARLADPTSACQPHAVFAGLVSRYLDPEDHQHWGQKYRDQRDYLARCHVLPALGGLRCDQVTSKTVGAWVTTMVDDGYARSTIEHALRLTRDVVEVGQDVGAFRAGPHPLRGVKVPKSAAGAATGMRTISRGEIPSERLVDAFVAQLAEHSAQWSLMGRITAETGLRWGELAGLHAAEVSGSGRRISVVRQLLEVDSGALSIEAVKTSASVREVVLSPATGELLAEYVAGLEDGHRGPIFRGARGGLLRRSNTNRRIIGPAQEAAGWPDGLTWHSLRHYAISSQLARLGTSRLAVISRAAGHSTTQVTLTRYVGADEDYADTLEDELWG